MNAEDDKRPTCETCPYWNRDGKEPEAVVHSGVTVWAECRRTGPNWEGDERRGGWLLSHHQDWCGEHPDMNAWIAHNRSEQSLHDKHVAWANEFKPGHRVMYCDGTKGLVIEHDGVDCTKVCVQFDDGTSLAVKPRDILKIDDDDART